MSFFIDPRISSSCFELADWPLSRVYLKNNAKYPWLILVPRLNDMQDMDQLSPEHQQLLMNEITQLSGIVKRYFNPDKLNVGTLGNIVSQLHIHVVARYTCDPLWPHGIWQSALDTQSYEEEALTYVLEELRQACSKTRWI